MKIGSFKFDERANDIVGKIATRELHFPYLIMRKVTERQSDLAPLYELFETNRAGDEIQIGAVWERKMSRSELTFLSGMIDDPSFREPLSIALFGDERSGFDVQWRRERDRDATGGNYGGRPGGGPRQGGSAGGSGARQGSSFAGGSTAGASGEYTGGGRNDLDDEVPF
jgi:uncharacterized protein (DUF736 family)